MIAKVEIRIFTDEFKTKNKITAIVHSIITTVKIPAMNRFFHVNHFPFCYIFIGNFLVVFHILILNNYKLLLDEMKNRPTKETTKKINYAL